MSKIRKNGSKKCTVRDVLESKFPFCPTSKMSHDRGWRAACLVTTWIPEVHFEMGEVARGVTAMVVGSGALLGHSSFERITFRPHFLTSSLLNSKSIDHHVVECREACPSIECMKLPI